MPFSIPTVIPTVRAFLREFLKYPTTTWKIRPDSGALSGLICHQFTDRGISCKVEERLRAVAQYFSDDRPGVVKAQEVACGYTRDALYQDCHRVVAAFHPRLPGPKPDPTRALSRRIEALEAEKQVLQAQLADLNALLCRCVEVTPQRIEDPVLTAVTTPPSYAGVGTYVAIAFGEPYRLSAGKVSQIVT